MFFVHDAISTAGTNITVLSLCTIYCRQEVSVVLYVGMAMCHLSFCYGALMW